MSTFPHDFDLLKKDLLKRDLRVVIFAPYKAMKRIELLKNGLIDDGYVNADMVYHLPNLPEFENIDEDIFSSKKSKYYLRDCDVALFILYSNVNHGSVTVEIEYFLSNLTHRFSCMSFLFEKKIELETVEEGTIKESGVEITCFTNDDELISLAINECWGHLFDHNCKKLSRSFGV